MHDYVTQKDQFLLTSLSFNKGPFCPNHFELCNFMRVGRKQGSKWALCTTAQVGNIKSGHLRILLYIAVVLCLVIGQLHVDKCVYHAICR